VGTIPVGLVGLLFKDYIEINLRSIEVIAYSTLIFGLLLGLASWYSANNDKPREIIGWLDVTFVGFMQAIALVPGVSRSGITITAGLLIGLSRNMAIQFAFLLSIPVIMLSAMLIIVDMYNQPQSVDWSVLVVGFIVAAISSYFTIVFFIKLLDRVGLMPFVVYRVVLGVLLLAL
jgi:undecaprenyl-diphosphatase